jgi:hypothetical protein
VAERVTEPRFPTVGSGRGHYESFYMRAVHPERPLGVWIRYTVHKRPDDRPQGSLWFTLFDAEGGRPRASKVTLAPHETHAGDTDYVVLGDSRFGPGRVTGRAATEQCDASWDLGFTSDEEPFRHLPRDWMYRAAIPRTKPLSPHPLAMWTGRVTVDGREIAIDGWPGMVGHNWGAQHAERWIWTHGVAFDGHPRTWLDGALGRIKLGPATTPWIANACLSIDGERHRLGGPGRVRATEVRETPTRCDFTLPGKGIVVRGSVHAPTERFVGWVYADPDGPEHNTVNSSIATMELTVDRPGRAPLELRTGHGAAYELGMRERDHGIPIEPFPDG